METGTKIVGILNITPDSFSDGGKFDIPKQAIKKAEEMCKDGAAVIDIGAESTRPGATILTHEEEWQRLEPILEKISQSKLPAKISIDTYHLETVQKALQYNIDWINDVSGLENEEVAKVISDSTASIVLMHNLGVPADKNITLPNDCDPIKEIISWGGSKLKTLEKYNINNDRIILDPGIGFGKTVEQLLEIIRRADELKSLGVKIMIGHSRKSFLSLFTDKPASERDFETSIISTLLAAKEIDYLRVHNVKDNINAVRIAEAAK